MSRQKLQYDFAAIFLRSAPRLSDFLETRWALVFPFLTVFRVISCVSWIESSWSRTIHKFHTKLHERPSRTGNAEVAQILAAKNLR